MAGSLTVALDLCNRIIKQYQESLGDGTTLSLLTPRQQCMVVYKKLLDTQETLQMLLHELPNEETNFPDVGQATLELVQVLTRAYETFFKECFYFDGIRTAFSHHGDLKETASRILYDLQWCRSVLCVILLKRVRQEREALQPEDCDGTLSVVDRCTLSTAAKKDHENLKTLLNDLKENHSCSGDCWNGNQVSIPCLATQLLEMIDFRAQPKSIQEEYKKGFCAVDSSKLSKWPLALLISPEDRTKGEFLNSGSFGNVFKTDWLGKTYAMKIPKPGCAKFLKDEIAALAGLHHPNILHVICCTEVRTECSYMMELMDMTLGDMLDKHPISGVMQAVDLMLQVAEGIRYLHSQGIVHRDLKPQNILVKNVKEVDAHPDSQSPVSGPLPNPGVWVAKVCDFGTSKAKNESTAYSHQTLTIGTTIYMAPEVYDPELWPEDKKPDRFHPMKTDVYSFGMLCCAIVTGKSTPFQDKELTPSKNFKDNVRKGRRPDLPVDCCPARLAWLIKQCWQGNPISRPSFQDICRELRYIKGLLLTDDKTTLESHPDLPRNDRNEIFQMEGPWGGRGGSDFVGCCSLMWTIESIEIWHGSGRTPMIRCLTIEYECNGCKFTEILGSQGGRKAQLSLKSDEFLTRIEGYHGIIQYTTREGRLVHGLSALTLHTNLNTYGPYGGGQEPNFTHFQSTAGKIVGLFGKAGAVIDALGVFISHNV